ncbi:cytochrome c biogenesis CcdA family protein, partial [Archaeoglobus sp.]
MLEILMAFALGIISVFSPCILPVIPLIFAGSRGKALNAALIVLGLTVSMFVAGFVVSLVSISAVKVVAYSFMLIFALSLLSEKLELRLSSVLSVLMSKFSRDLSTVPSFVFGFLLAFIWLPCIVPFAGIAISQTLISENPYIMLFYGLGMALAISFVFKLGERIVV